MPGPAAEPLPPASGAWQDGDPAGRRRWVSLAEPLALEAGGELTGVRIAYETWGRLAPDASNAVLLLHALTGDSHAAGPAGPGHPTAGWWDGLIGTGRALDPDRWFIVAPNVLGGCQGSTGPAARRPDGRRWGSSFPVLTQRDQVAAEARLADLLGIERWALVAGGSMGGMRALEWAVGHPRRTGALLVLAAPAAATARQLACTQVQLAAIRADPGWRGGDYHDAGPGRGPHTGLGIARRLAHLTYRGRAELEHRFGRAAQPGEDPWHGGRRQVESYLDHHAAKLVRRFDAGSYVVLAEAMNHHDIGRARGGTAAALARITAPAVIAGVDSDELYPPPLQARLAAAVPGAEHRVIASPHGHDGFLIETAQVSRMVHDLLGPPAPPTGRWSGGG
ncbi:homoserine O-acetyltransferase [Streptomyces sulfonofaciens]|uniref:Homoserine O-acetyltransferase n=1 Tax=Streptomyces sulfonofaciens TaxID=68272 RepID=A0A919G517_9ACTN|nr:homoserine O-acetyltransferase [Streptomyces sulfonofaciens]GHH78200.1 homoserine O-acetyltransferase [Streptomyces sulfonofaciens]